MLTQTKNQVYVKFFKKTLLGVRKCRLSLSLTEFVFVSD